MEKLTYNRNLYSIAALLKAAYHFTDRFYVYLDMDDANYFIELTAKSGVDDSLIQGEFSNELLAQATREAILQQTSNIRELILGRAFGSTIIEDTAEEVKDGTNIETTLEIFKDWYNHE